MVGNDAHLSAQAGNSPPHVEPETKVKQGGGPRMTVWVLIASVALAVLVGALLLFDRDEVPPSEFRDTTQSAPAEQSPPAVAPNTNEPQTNQ